MKSVSTDFLNAINKTDSPGVEVQLWMSNFSKSEDMANRTSYLDLASVGNITERIERELNEFQAGDVNLRVFNVDDFFVNDAGTGLFERDDIIRIQLRFKFQGIDDTITKFDGYLDRDSVMRKGKNLIEFHCISWHKDLENWNAEEVADKTKNPFKNITGLKWEYGHADHPVILGGGDLGVHALKHTFEKIGSDTVKHHYWQYDSGDKVKGNSDWVTVWNEYKQYEGTNNALKTKIQGIKFKIVDSLPDDSQTDTIVVIWDYEQGFMVPAYWYEDIHLKTLVNHLLDSVGRDEFHSTGVIDTAKRKIKVRDIEMGTGERIFSYFNPVVSDKKCYSCIYMGGDWFVFNLDDDIMRVKKESTDTLIYELIGSVSGSMFKIFKMWKIGDNVWGIMGSAYDNITEIFKLIGWNSESPTITEYSINLFGDYHLYQYCCDMDIDNNKFYYVLDHLGLFRGGKIAVFDLGLETFTELHYDNLPKGGGTSGISFVDEHLYYYTTRDNLRYLIDYDITNDIYTPAHKNHTGWFALAYSESDNKVYSTDGISLDLLTMNTIDIGKTAKYIVKQGDEVYGWNVDKTHIVIYQKDNIVEYTDDTFIYDTKSPPCLYSGEAESGSFFGITHNKTGGNFYTGWMFSDSRNAFIVRADFSGMTVRDALDNLATAFLCNYQRTGYGSVFFYYREFARGGIYNLPLSQYYHPPKIAFWKEQYDGVIVEGQNLQGETLQWASGEIVGWNVRVLTITSRFLTDTLGQTVAMWMYNFFKRKRKVFYVNMKFLMQLELQDEVQFKLPWDNVNTLYAFCYELEYQHDKYQIRGKLVELEGEETKPLVINRIGHELVVI